MTIVDLLLESEPHSALPIVPFFPTPLLQSIILFVGFVCLLADSWGEEKKGLLLFFISIFISSSFLMPRNICFTVVFYLLIIASKKNCTRCS